MSETLAKFRFLEGGDYIKNTVYRQVHLQNPYHQQYRLQIIQKASHIRFHIF